LITRPKAGQPSGVLDADGDRARAFARHRRHVERAQGADTGGRQIAGNAINAHAIGAVGGDRHVEHRVGADIVGKRLAQRGVLAVR
jgi:hypothetical protein